MSLNIPSQLQGAVRVQEILQGTTSTRPVCAECRIQEADLPDPTKKMLRCTRCKVAHYCSSACQKKHFGFHKQSCKDIAELRAKIETTTHDVASSLATLGDELVTLGYRETDTIVNGSVYYREALRCYVQILPLDKAAFFYIENPLEDKVLLMLVLLGADEDTLKEWTKHSESPRSLAYEQSDLPLDVPFQMLSKMLCQMKSLASFRQENPESEDPPYKEEIEETVRRLQSHGKGDYLIHLRDHIPLEPKDAPELFRPTTIREFWLLYQDCFFLTPGLNNVLHDFVPEEDSPQWGATVDG